MCDPFTILLAVSTAVTAAGSLAKGAADKQAGEYNAQLAEQNSVLAKQQATEEERRFRVQSRKQLGAMRAAYAASGVTMEGSPMDVLEESAYIAELDALTIREGGRASASAYEAEARLARLQGRQGERAGYISAAADLAGGGTDYYRMTAT